MLRLEIVTPEKRVLDADVDSVTVPTASGEAGILPHHAPLVSALKPGVLTYSIKGTTDKLAVSGGFVEVNNDKVAVLVDTAESSDEIQSETARTDRAEAERTISAAGAVTADDAEAAREVIEHAQARLEVSTSR
ncbi:MAG TPA: F0F1 ATP synthase subunit epsilon [Pyrinomonadaceae bacterium]|jgi:F-type H+-transporting ATPase subunit epsilon|nr:F0F1 ATP synthase subunit epsilon [Pyrinomonadaceae bacterium]